MATKAETHLERITVSFVISATLAIVLVHGVVALFRVGFTNPIPVTALARGLDDRGHFGSQWPLGLKPAAHHTMNPTRFNSRRCLQLATQNRTR